MISDKPRFFIGIDPGVNTGVAIWDRMAKKLQYIGTHNIVESIDLIRIFIAENGRENILIIFEDANKRFLFESNEDRALPDQIRLKAYNSKLQGAGSVKRDSKIWHEVCNFYKIKYMSKAPASNLNKIAESRDTFKKYTGISIRSSVHARCAAMLVFGI